MANTPDYHWPPMDKRRVMGKRISRLDGLAKSTGAAKYNSDLKPDGMLYGALLTAPYAHAKVKSIDASAAEKFPGVTAVRVVAPAGTELQWAGAEIAYLAARTEEIANDAVRLIKVDYEVMPHLVNEEDLSKVGNRARPAGEQVSGDTEQACKDADAIAEGSYGIPRLTHCCLEPHGQTIAVNGDKAEYFPSNQNGYGIDEDIGRDLEIPYTNLHVHMDYMDAGFGINVPADSYGIQSDHV